MDTFVKSFLKEKEKKEGTFHLYFLKNIFVYIAK